MIEMLKQTSFCTNVQCIVQLSAGQALLIMCSIKEKNVEQEKNHIFYSHPVNGDFVFDGKECGVQHASTSILCVPQPRETNNAPDSRLQVARTNQIRGTWNTKHATHFKKSAYFLKRDSRANISMSKKKDIHCTARVGTTGCCSPRRSQSSTAEEYRRVAWS